MRRILFIIVLLSIFSCGDTNKEADHLKIAAALQTDEALEFEEAITKQFIENYLRDVNSPSWRSKLPIYLALNPDEFLAEHAAFRESFVNYQSTIKHLTVDGNEGIVWMNITANYANTYAFESDSSIYRDAIFKGIKAENQALSWDETWYFNVVDGKFGDKWDFLKDNYAVLEGLKAIPK